MKISIDELAFRSDQIIASQDVDKIATLLEEVTLIKEEEFNELEWAYLHFIEANIYLALRSIKNQAAPLEGWNWESNLLEEEIFALRCAENGVTGVYYHEDKTDLRMRISTNLGNAFNHIGRFAEAIEHWDNALNYDVAYAMALGNKGYGLTWYAKALYDPGHQTLFF